LKEFSGSKMELDKVQCAKYEGALEMFVFEGKLGEEKQKKG
jgi:hypothetical protein